MWWYQKRINLPKILWGVNIHISFTLNTYFAHQHQPVSTLHSIQHNQMHFKRVNAQNSLAKDKILLVLSCYGSKEVTQGFSAVIKTNCRKSVVWTSVQQLPKPEWPKCPLSSRKNYSEYVAKTAVLWAHTSWRHALLPSAQLTCAFKTHKLSLLQSPRNNTVPKKINK